MSERAILVSFLAVLGLGLLGLSGCGGGSSPTEPGEPPIPTGGVSAATGAVVDGQINSVKSSAASVAFAAQVAVAPGGGSASSSAGPVSGITVRVQGTELAAVSDAAGRFVLQGVPTGDRVLVFENASERARLGLDQVKSNERIELAVSLDGSSVAVDSMSRSGGGAVVTGTLVAEIAIEKATNGHDADLPPGPEIVEGEPVEWVYLVTNTGDESLTGVTVTDDQGVVVSCPSGKLDPGQSMTCTGSGVALLGQYANVGTASGSAPDGTVVDGSDPSHYFGVAAPGGAEIAIEKATNGEDADLPPGPSIPEGEPVEWTYEVANTGGQPLTGVVVSDDQGVAVSCPVDTLDPGESMICTGSGVAVLGQYANVGTASGTAPDGSVVSADDPSHYFGEAGGGDDYTVEIQPDHWNTNWPRSNGTVSAVIRGGDLSAIDPGSIVLFETDPAAAVLPVSLPRITGNHIRARFEKEAAFLMLVDPLPGEVRTVTVSFLAAGATVDLPADIVIVGPGD